LVDGYKGTVIINPDKKTVEKYLEEKKIRSEEESRILRGLKGTVKDCRNTFANLVIAREMECCQRVNHNLTTAIGLLDMNNESAAAAPLAAAVRHLRKELLNLRFNTRQRFWRNKKSKRLTVRKGVYRNAPIDGQSVPVLALGKQSYALDWEAAAACDHIIDSEIDEVLLCREQLKIIKRVRARIKGLIARLESNKLVFETEIDNAGQEFGQIYSVLNPRWKQDKFIAERSLGLGRLLIKYRLRNANEVLGLPAMFLKMRRTEARLIVRAIEGGRLFDLRSNIRVRNQDILGRISRIGLEFKSSGFNLQAVLHQVYGLINLRAINTKARIKGNDPTDEPEFVGLCGLFGQIATQLQREPINVQDINLLNRRAEYQVQDAQYLVEFIADFRRAWMRARLSGVPLENKEDVFFNVYMEFAKNNNFVRGSPYLWAYFWRAAFIPYRIGKEKPRPVSLVFDKVTSLYRIHQLTRLKSALTRHIIIKHDTVKDGRIVRKACPITYQAVEDILRDNKDISVV